jgi:adenosine deaminase
VTAKAELHVHLEGTASPKLMRRIASRNKLEVPYRLVGDDERYDWKDFTDFLALYDTAVGVLRTVEDYREIVHEYLLRAADDGALYVELTASPDHAAKAGLSDAEHVFALGRGIDDARRDAGIEARVVMTCVRDSGPERAEEIARWLVANPHPVVTGFGLAGDEAAHPPAAFARAFAIAAEGGLGCTAHAGEWAGPESVRAALELPGVTRIDHGVRAIEDPALVEDLAARGIVLAVAVTSNVALGVYPSYAEHPLRALHDAGVRVTLNSDDPPYWGTTLAREYALAAERFGFTDAELEDCTRTALEAAFVDDATRERLLEAV